MTSFLSIRSLFGVGFAACLAGLLVVIVPAQEPDTPPGVVTTLKGHDETIYSITFSADGKSLLTGSFDKSVKLWDAASGKELRTFAGPNGHQNLVLSLAFAPDGQTFASGGADNTAKVWDIPMRQALRELALTEAATAAAISPDAKFLAAASKDGAIKLWNAADGKETFRLTGHVGPVTNLAFTGNGQFLVSTGMDSTMRFWNPANGQNVAVVGAHSAPVLALGLAANGTAGYTAGADGLLKFWQMPPVPPRPFPAHGDSVTCLALSADGATLVTGCSDKNVRVLNFENGQLARTQTAPAPVTSVAVFGAGANTVTAAGTNAGHFLLWANDGKLIFQAKAHAGEVTGIAVHPQGNQVLTSAADGSLKIWNLPLAPTKALAHPADVRALAITADGKRIASGAADNLRRATQTCLFLPGLMIRSVSGIVTMAIRPQC
jgi:WD40 repeat protein